MRGEILNLETPKNLEYQKRISRVENQLAEPTFCYFISQKQSTSQNSEHLLNFDFEVKAKTYLKIKLTYQIVSSVLPTLKIILNGAPAHEVALESLSGQIELVLPFLTGENLVSVNFSSESQFTVQNCTLETFGNLAYIEKECILQVINEESRSLILFLNGKSLTVQSYQDGQFSLLLAKEGVKSASLCKMGENYLLAHVDESGQGEISLYLSDFKLDYYKDLDSNLISVCSFGGDTPSVFGVRGSKIYRYDIEEMLFFRRRETGYTGKKLKSNPQVNGYVIIIDFDGNAKLVKV